MTMVDTPKIMKLLDKPDELIIYLKQEFESRPEMKVFIDKLNDDIQLVDTIIRHAKNIESFADKYVKDPTIKEILKGLSIICWGLGLQCKNLLNFSKNTMSFYPAISLSPILLALKGYSDGLLDIFTLVFSQFSNQIKELESRIKPIEYHGKALESLSDIIKAHKKLLERLFEDGDKTMASDKDKIDDSNDFDRNKHYQ